MTKYVEMIKANTKSSGQYAESVAAIDEFYRNSQQINMPDNAEFADSFIQYAIDAVINGATPWPEKFLIILLLQNGLRVSEIADPERLVFLENQKIGVYSYKQSVYKIYNVPEILSHYNTDFHRDVIRSWKRSRQHYYRYLNNLIEFVQSSRKKNNAVTHAARNLLAQSVYARNFDINDVMRHLGIVSKSSAILYLTKEQIQKELAKAV